MKDLLKALNERPIAFQPVYKRITGSATAAILLSQLMYWWAKVDGREFYKTDHEIMEETALSEKELRNAKEKLRVLPFIQMTLRGVPPKTYYLIDHEGLTKSIVENPFSNSAQRANLNSAQRAKTKPPKGRNSDRPKGENNTGEYTGEYTGESEQTLSLTDRIEQIQKQNPDLPPHECRVLAAIQAVGEYLRQQPTAVQVITNNLKNRAKLGEKAGATNVLTAEVEAWVRYNALNAVFMSDPVARISTGAGSLKTWLSRWDGYYREKESDKPGYVKPVNIF